MEFVNNEKMVALSLTTYLYAQPTVQERVMLGLTESRAERTSRMMKQIKDLDQIMGNTQR
jgi:hypothetical protein